MYKIRLFNSISDIIKNYLPEDRYTFVTEGDDYDAAIVRSASLLNTEFSPSVKAIARAGAGYNNIPVDKCTQAGIVVSNTPGANANAVCETVIAGMLLSSHRILEGVNWVKTLKGNGAEVLDMVEKGKSQFVGTELRGKTLGVIGVGAVGSLVANAAQALGMTVLGHDPFISVQSAWTLSRNVIRANNRDELIRQSDYISVHVPTTAQNRNMFNDEMFAMMKPGACLINFSRADIVDTQALLRALDSGHLASYVTDFPVDEVLDHKRVIGIPHLGSSTEESENNCAAMAAHQIREYLEGGAIINSLNFPNCGDLPANYKWRVTVLHKNTPNMVSGITRILGENNGNISNMTNRSNGDYASTVVEMEEPPSQEVINRIEQIEGIIRIYMPNRG